MSVLLVIAVGFFIYLKLTKDPAANEPQDEITYFTPQPTPTIPAGNTVKIATEQGDVVVKNFYASAIKMIESSVYLTDSENYSIIFFPKTNQFLISLNAYTAQDADLYRSQAENDLKQLVLDDENALCKLNVSQIIPQVYNDELSTTDYHLSFCLNGVAIPGAVSSSPTGIR